MSNATNGALPNPDVYLNHLPPDEARQLEIVRNLYIAVVGVVACDILSFIPGDITTIKRSKGFSTPACFILARIFALTYMALWVTMSTTPVRNCNGLNAASNFFCVVTMATTGFLFLRRVQAVYAPNRVVQWFFAFLWVGCCGVVFALIPGTEARHIAGTGYCSVYEVAGYVPLANFMPAVFDTLVFLGVSYRLAFQTNRESGTQKGWTTSWFSTKGLPRLQRVMVEGGQQYYFIAIVLQLGGGIVAFLDAIPPIGRVACTVPGVALSACMACRAHRIMVDAFYRREVGTIPVMSVIGFTPRNLPDSSSTMAELEGGIVAHKDVETARRLPSERYPTSVSH